MRLIQWNPKLSLQMILLFTLVGGLIGFLYHFRFGYELLTPKPLDVPEVAPEVRDGISPKVCVGYLPDIKSWGYTRSNCPKNHVMVANFDISGRNKTGPGEFVALDGLCCPLPADDILTENHVYNEFEECPDQYVATGGAGNSSRCEVNCSMRCTRINTKKYMLGPERQSFYAKHSDAGRLFGQGSARRVFWKQLPSAIRWGINRSNHSKWSKDGCFGYPFGSILTRKSGKRCDSFYYRQLLYLDQTPVAMIPECAEISDPYDPNPKCLQSDAAARAPQAINIID